MLDAEAAAGQQHDAGLIGDAEQDLGRVLGFQHPTGELLAIEIARDILEADQRVVVDAVGVVLLRQA